MRVTQVLLITATCLLWLAGCETSTKLGDVFRSNDNGAQAMAPPSDSDATGTVSAPGDVPGATSSGLLGSDPNDDLSIGKKYFRQEDYGLSERYFRRAVETHPKDGEAWLGLAAAYDHLKRFDLADRAYREAIAIVGPTAEVLNNQGYSYILRGDYRHAREKLAAAQSLDPGNPYINNNLALLAKSARKGKAVQ
jgi:Flp pilus assembly protein TadD